MWLPFLHRTKGRKKHEKCPYVVRMLEPEGLHLGLTLTFLRNKSWRKDEVAELAWVCICPSAQTEQNPQTFAISWVNPGVGRKTSKVNMTTCYSQL